MILYYGKLILSTPYILNMERLTIEKFKENANIIHNHTYDYSLVNYINAHTKIEIICSIHGSFNQTPDSHRRSGCPKCGIGVASEKRSLSLYEFIERANLIHENKYDYSKFCYKTHNTKSIIICPIHGEFIKRANDHLNGKQGCNQCSILNYKLPGGYTKNTIIKFKDIKSILYIANIFIEYIANIFNEYESFYKIGVTITSINERLKKLKDIGYTFKALLQCELYLPKAFYIEQLSLTQYSKYKYFPKYTFSGHTECLSIIPEISII